MAEIDLKIEGLSGTSTDPDPADKLPVVQGEPITREGDCWFLDDHRILCGNALQPESYKTLLQGSAAQIVFTDPPYNVRIDGHASGMGAIHHPDFAMASGEMSSGQFTEFLATALGHLAAYTVDGAILFACMDWRHQRELLNAADKAGLELKNLCVWAKDNGGMGSFYRSQHELVFVFKNSQAPHQNNIQLGNSLLGFVDKSR